MEFFESNLQLISKISGDLTDRIDQFIEETQSQGHSSFYESLEIIDKIEKYLSDTKEHYSKDDLKDLLIKMTKMYRTKCNEFSSSELLALKNCLNILFGILGYVPMNDDGEFMDVEQLREWLRSTFASYKTSLNIVARSVADFTALDIVIDRRDRKDVYRERIRELLINPYSIIYDNLLPLEITIREDGLISPRLKGEFLLLLLALLRTEKTYIKLTQEQSKRMIPIIKSQIIRYYKETIVEIEDKTENEKNNLRIVVNMSLYLLGYDLIDENGNSIEMNDELREYIRKNLNRRYKEKKRYEKMKRKRAQELMKRFGELE